MDFDIGKIFEQISKLKLKGGIFQKASIVVIVISICIFIMAILIGNIWLTSGSILLIFILAFVTLWRLLNFADKNPQAAILEGAEFLVHERIQLAAKGIDKIPESNANVIEETYIELDIESQREANKPDVKEVEGDNE